MPELPEVETVRLGLERWVVGRRVRAVQALHPRSVRRHIAGGADFTARLAGARLEAVRRRGKYLWFELDTGSALVVHLGMSGQLLIQPSQAPDERHLHVRFDFDDGGPQLRFIDQRTFGGLMIDELVATERVGEWVPALIAHIARDPLDPALDEVALRQRLRRRESAIKRTLLDQSTLSGIGNIYADESLWRARLHPERNTASLPAARITQLLGHIRQVLTEAIKVGGTSFDSLYVNVNGASGYFDRSLNAYGREGRPCPRCGAPIRRVAFMNRSSFFCARCQRRPPGEGPTLRHVAGRIVDQA